MGEINLRKEQIIINKKYFSNKRKYYITMWIFK